MEPSTAGKGQGNKSGKKRNSPSAKMYLAVNRQKINADKRAVRHARRVMLQTTKTLRVPHGFARAVRRGNECNILTFTQ